MNLKLQLQKLASEKLTELRKRHARIELGKKSYYPRNFLGDDSLNLLDHPVVHNDIFPSTDIKPWLDRDDASSLIEKKLDNKEISEQQAQACQYFSDNGYFIAPSLFSAEEVDRTFDDYEQSIDNGKIKLNANRRILNPHFDCPKVNNMLRNKRIMSYIRLFLGENAIVPFQSIGSHFGSEQLEHSDAIHMTTYPLGYLSAAWISCDNVQKGSGELMYYPGSHKLGYALSKEVGFHPSEYLEKGRNYVYHELYEPHIQKLLEKEDLKVSYFYPQKGDVLFWHHNLIHGGSEITDDSLSRKAFVFHYYAKKVIRYHEIFGGMANIRV